MTEEEERKREAERGSGGREAGRDKERHSNKETLGPEASHSISKELLLSNSWESAILRPNVHNRELEGRLLFVYSRSTTLALFLSHSSPTWLTSEWTPRAAGCCRRRCCRDLGHQTRNVRTRNSGASCNGLSRSLDLHATQSYVGVRGRTKVQLTLSWSKKL